VNDLGADKLLPWFNRLMGLVKLFVFCTIILCATIRGEIKIINDLIGLLSFFSKHLFFSVFVCWFLSTVSVC